jgi:hypothetical protein
MRNEKTAKTILRLPLEKRAEMAFKETVEDVIDEHARLGLPLQILRDGKVVSLSGARPAPRFRSGCGKIDQRVFLLCDIRPSFTLSSSFLFSKIAKYRRTSRTIISGFPPPALQGIGHLIPRAG